jgi:hypothetical protein
MRIRWTEPASGDYTNVCDYSDAHFGLDRGYKTAMQVLDSIDARKKDASHGAHRQKAQHEGAGHVGPALHHDLPGA